MTDDLVAFILARIAEDEQAAIDANAEHERYPSGPRRHTIRYPHPQRDATADLNGHYNVSRVLCGVTAKRQMVDLWKSTFEWSQHPDCPPSERATVAAAARGLREALQLLAVEWGMHPDYRRATNYEARLQALLDSGGRQAGSA
jgi:hypothetical protein